MSRLTHCLAADEVFIACLGSTRPLLLHPPLSAVEQLLQRLPATALYAVRLDEFPHDELQTFIFWAMRPPGYAFLNNVAIVFDPKHEGQG